jgi:hypothetical protein
MTPFGRNASKAGYRFIGGQSTASFFIRLLDGQAETNKQMRREQNRTEQSR